MPQRGQVPSSQSFSTLEKLDEFKVLREDWTRLWAMTRLSFFSSWEWSWAWWQVYSDDLPKSARLKIFVYRESPQGEVLAILPTYEVGGNFGTRKKLSLLGVGEPTNATVYSEFLDVICPTISPAVVTWVTEIFRTYDQISFGVVRAQSMILSVLQATDFSRFALRKVMILSYRAELSHGFDVYLSHLSPNSRTQARKILKQLDSAGITLTSPETPNERLIWFERLVALHQQQWRERGAQGAFNDPRTTRFHCLILSLAPQVRIYRLAHLGADIGYIYGFLTPEQFDWYQMAIDFTAANLPRPGYALQLATMRMLSSTSATQNYEFLAGSNQLKKQLGPLREEAFFLELNKITLSYRLKATILAIFRHFKQLLNGHVPK